MIPAYNPGALLQITLASVCEATSGRDDVEIVVVDDGSMPPLADADMPENVRLLRNTHNRGPIGNFNRAVELATGTYVHILHADDLVRPGYYESMERGFAAGAGLATCRVERIDATGRVLGLYRKEQSHAGIWPQAFEVLAVSNRTPAPAIAVTRSTFELIGDFDETLDHAADWDMWLRIASIKPVFYDPAPLVAYRVHADQHTAAAMRSGESIRQALAVIERLDDRCTDSKQARQLVSRAYAYRGIFAARIATEMFRSGNWRSALRQVRLVFVCVWRAALRRLSRENIDR